MAMNTHVVAIKSPDEKWRKMKAIYDACTDAEVEIPDEVDDYFNNEPPDEDGVVIELEDEACCAVWNEDGFDGYIINLSLLPKDVTSIKFFNSY